VTIPHKETIIPLLDELSREATAIGAVNCVTHGDGRLVGHNTDVIGFMAGLDEAGWDAASGPVVVLGAGGAARAVGWGAASRGVETVVVARRLEQAERLVAELRPRVAGDLHAVSLERRRLEPWLARASVLVNTTPVGMWPRVGESPLPAGVRLPAGLLAYDLIFNPSPTAFLREAAAAGCRTQSGVAMLVDQGVAAFRLWTGQTLDRGVMARAVTRALAASGEDR
jgi:shikimate dehydrogenase